MALRRKTGSMAVAATTQSHATLQSSQDGQLFAGPMSNIEANRTYQTSLRMKEAAVQASPGIAFC